MDTLLASLADLRRPFGVVMLLWALAAWPVAARGQTSGCPRTPLEDRLPSVIAPMAGSEPIWLVDGSFGRWTGEDHLEKSVWVLSRPISGRLVVTGRRLGDHLPMRFLGSKNGPPAERLIIRDPGERSVMPGGSTSEILDQYAFVMMYLIYPSPGCWEITARLGEQERRIVVEVTAQDQETEGR